MSVHHDIRRARERVRGTYLELPIASCQPFLIKVKENLSPLAGQTVDLLRTAFAVCTTVNISCIQIKCDYIALYMVQSIIYVWQ